MDAEWFEQRVPEGKHIIGVKCVPLDGVNALTNLQFLLSDDTGQLAGELTFPPSFQYPNEAEFKDLYMAVLDDEGVPEDIRVSKITISQMTDVTKHQLSGIQLHFSNGMESDLIRTQKASERDALQEIFID